MKMQDMKAGFFDRAKIVRSVDRATRNVLSKFGAFVRTAAKSSIRKRNRTSAPGSPPSSHTGLLKQFIYFAYEPDRQSVVIGPARLRRPGSTPEVLEHGGQSVVATRVAPKKYKRRRVTIAKRPFMHPALNQELPKLPAMWRNSVKP